MSTTPSLSLHLDFTKILVAGAGSRFSACLINQGTEPLHNIAITFDCADFDPPEQTLEIDDLPALSRQEKAVSVMPAQVGSRPLNCIVEFTQGTQTHSLHGTWDGLTIFERPSSQVSITNIVQDVQSHRSNGDKAEFGAMKGDVSINMTSNLAQVQTLNDLLAITLPSSWQEVKLKSLTGTASLRTSDRRRIPATFLRVYEPISALLIRQLGAAPLAANDPTPHGWRFRGGNGSQLVLGRSSNDADLVTRFMPADPTSDSKSVGLSRKQARLSAHPSGMVNVENISSGNVVIVGRSAVPVGGSSLLSSDQALSLGTPPADLRLGVRLTPPSNQPVRVMNLADWQGYGPSRHLPPEMPATWGHAVFEWQNSAPSYWQTVWFSQLAAFGSAPDVPVSLPDSGLDACHGFFHYLCGCYWLEVVSTRGGITVSDPLCGELAVLPGMLVPLRSGMTLNLGGQIFTLTKAA